MSILIVGAGAIGGYFGGRLLAAGRDVTFLLRPARAEEMARLGLRIQSPQGDVHYPAPPVVTSETLDKHYDLILLSCKSYDLESAMDSFAAAVGPNTVIMPLLNGMAHLDRLKARFNPANVLGGLCLISTDRDPSGAILHLNTTHQLTYGELDGQPSERTARIAEVFADAGFDGVLTQTIVQEMWEKWSLITSIAGITCLMRSAIGDIVAAGGEPLIRALLDECGAVAAKAGYPLRAPVRERFLALLTEPGSKLTASMLRDVERNSQTEADHLLGDMLARRGAASGPSVLELAYTHLKAFEARRVRSA